MYAMLVYVCFFFFKQKTAYEMRISDWSSVVCSSDLFTADPKPGERQFLRFGAVNYRARIYLNGKSVGAHEGGFTTFAFEVTGLLKPGANQITIGVDSERSDTDLPPPVTDWETYGGITRAVTLVTTPATYVDDE